jgi:plasmid maintenance system antidote protein VapI
MSIMFNALHPGELLKEYLDGTSVTNAAKALGVTRANLSRIL